MPHTAEHKIPIEEIFWQSPIPDVYRGEIAPGPPGILDDPPKKKEKKVEKEVKDKGSILDWFISPAGAEAGLTTDDRSLPWINAFRPMWQLADAEYRTQLDPQGVAQFSNLYQNPSKYANLAYYYPKDEGGYFPHGLMHSVDAFHMNSPSEFGETEWRSHPVMPDEAILPNQLFRQGHSYLSTAGMDRPAVPDQWWVSNPAMRGLRKGPEDNWHHEAFHDASTKAATSEFMPQPYRAMYQYFSLAKGMGIRIEEALAQYHDMLYPKSLYAAEASKEWLEDATQEAESESLNMSNSSQEQKVWGLYLKTLKNLGMMYDAILGAARKRHESLGYK